MVERLDDMGFDSACDDGASDYGAKRINTLLQTCPARLRFGSLGIDSRRTCVCAGLVLLRLRCGLGLTVACDVVVDGGEEAEEGEAGFGEGGGAQACQH